MSNTFEILARGRCFNGNWYEGDMQHLRNGDVVIRPKDSTDGLGYYVDPQTVSVFVQRTDKNGKHVFVGDICRLKGVIADTGESYDELFCVGFDSKSCMFSIDGNYAEFLPSKEEFFEECEVVGNKWDNPELMSGGAK